MVERPNPREIREEQLIDEAIRLATFQQSENTRGGMVAPFPNTHTPGEPAKELQCSV